MTKQNIENLVMRQQSTIERQSGIIELLTMSKDSMWEKVNTANDRAVYLASEVQRLKLTYNIKEEE